MVVFEDFLLVFAECPERFARPEILEGDYGGNRNYRDK
jgi:hypothetical protein